MQDCYWWWDSDGNGAADESRCTEFKEGGKYYLRIVLAPEGGYTFPTTPVLGRRGTLNKYTGTITMNLSAETDDLDASLEAIDARIQALEGYVEGQNVSGGSSGSGRHRFANLTIRVPANQVDSFVEEIAGLTNVVSSSRNVQDITLTYTDTASRVTALETEQARLLELMEQAETMSDLLEIEARLTEVRYQLESYASTLRLYDNQVDYATVSLYITEVEKYTPVEEPGFWEKITGGLWDSVVNLGETIVAFVSWLIIDLPYLALIALIAWAVIGITRRSFRKRKAKKENNTTK